jgi:ribosomal protein L24E
MTVHICVFCEAEFQPKHGANTLVKYCSKKCKGKAKYRRERDHKPLERAAAKRRAYLSVKSNPSRLERHRLHGRTTRHKAREWLANYKTCRGCFDCGYNEHSSALQLDHEGPKSVSIADARTSIGRLKREIESGMCVVRCANCHSIWTWERKQEGKFSLLRGRSASEFRAAA